MHYTKLAIIYRGQKIMALASKWSGLESRAQYSPQPVGGFTWTTAVTTGMGSNSRC